jgi:hypothetical protein
MNGICGCGLPAHCCQPAVAGGFIYADLRGELNTHLALQALFTQSSPVQEPLLQAFPFPSTPGEVILHPHSLACMFVYSSRGKWVFPLSCGVFLPLLLCKLSHFWLLGMCCCSCQPLCLFTVHMGSGSSPLFCGVFLPPPLSPASPLLVARGMSLLPSSPARPSLFIYSCRRESHLSLFSAQGTPPSLLCVFIVLIAFFCFFPRWGLVCLGGYSDLAQGCLWKYHISLSSPCLRLPKSSGHGRLAARGPSWFLRLMWSGDALCRLEVWMGQNFASSWCPYL